MRGRSLVFFVLLLQLGQAVRIRKQPRLKQLFERSCSHHGEQNTVSDESPESEDGYSGAIGNSSVAKGAVSQLWDKLGIPNVGSWNSKNRQHCQLASVWNTFCRRSACLASCDRNRLSAEVCAKMCVDRWQNAYNDFDFDTKVNVTSKQEIDFSTEDLDRWMRNVSQTAPPCEAYLMHITNEGKIPGACQKEDHLHEGMIKLLHQHMAKGNVVISNDTSSNETNDATDELFNAEAPVPVEGEDRTRLRAQVPQAVVESVSTPLSFRPSGNKVFGSLELMWLKSWHFLNRMHCDAGLASVEWCERNAYCLKCQAKRSGLANRMSKASGEQRLGTDRIKGFHAKEEEAVKGFSRRTIPMGNVKRCDVVRTCETCEPCTADNHAGSILQACWHEHNVCTEVWFICLGCSVAILLKWLSKCLLC